jgi:hypothetical protein
MHSRSRVVLVLLALCLLLSGCGLFGGGDDAGKEARKLVRELRAGGGDAAFKKLTEPLAGLTSTVELGKVKTTGDKATAEIDWATDLGGQSWKHTGSATLVKKGGAWKVQWTPSILEKSLRPGVQLTVTRIRAQRGNILGAGDQPLVVPRPVTRFGIDKSIAPVGTAADAARRLAGLVRIAPAPYVKAVTQAGPKAFVQAIALREPQVTQGLLAGVAAIKGARGISDHLPLAPTKEFAAPLLGTVGPVTAELVEKSKGRLRAGDDTGLSGLQLRYDEQLFGTPGIKVSALADPKATPDTLFEAGPVAGKDLHLTLESRLQTEAEKLLAGVGPASAVVALQPSTGKILAAASGPGSKGYNTATFGQYAPGSTFKVISALALLRSGLTPASTVPCTPTITVNGKLFKNYSDYPSGRLGRISLTEALANSCNTAFISQRGKLKGSIFADAAAALGVGVDQDLGFPAYFGQAPAPASETEKAADMIGQGKVLASPMAMAAVVASVVKGATVVPQLVTDHRLTATAPKAPMTRAEAAQLRALMHAVVEEGSGVVLRDLQPPDVLAKTGTAEYGTGTKLPTHTWMIGAQGDLAVAVFVATGQSGSRTAGPILKAFLRFAR